MRFLENTDLNIIPTRRTGYIVAGTFFVICILSIIFRGFNLGIDFKGGTEIITRFQQPVEVGNVRSALAAAGVGGEVKEYGTNREFIIRTDYAGNMDNLQNTLTAALNKGVPQNPHEILQLEAVGPSIASDLQTSALYALIGSFFVILIYIGIRFEFKFATIGVLTTIFDVLIVAGIFSLLGNVFGFMPLEIDQTIIAAFLTISGYSINDKVVIYDRIRENLKARRSEPYEKIFNDSINETFSRTIITGLSVLFTLVILFIFGGQAIRGLAFATLIGILIGTFSSIFIAAPVALDWILQSKTKLKLRG